MAVLDDVIMQLGYVSLLKKEVLGYIESNPSSLGDDAHDFLVCIL